MIKAGAFTKKKNIRTSQLHKIAFIGLVLILFGVAGFGMAQIRVDNPGRAQAKNAGRIVMLEEVLRIRDDGATAIFKSPRNFVLGQHGSLFVMDHSEGPQVYHFSSDGKLISKFLETGQGPGEAINAMNYLVTNDRIRVLSWIPPKIMDFGLDGRYLNELRVQEDIHGLWFLGSAGGKIYGIRDEVFGSAAFRSSGIFSVPNSVYEISADFKIWKKLYDFPVRMSIKRANAIRLDPIDAAICGSTLYILHTAEYQVIEFDLRTGSVKRIIARRYDRVLGDAAKQANPDPETKHIVLPSDPYVWDIHKIHAAAAKLWVFTSVMKPDGDDQQVDLFDTIGRYVDSFILRFPAGRRTHRARWTLLTDDGFFFIPEQEDDGLISIGKYRIGNSGLFR